MATTLIQPAFSRGELSPNLQARVDLAAYGTGVALAENFIVLPDGGMQTRPGFQYCGKVKDSTKQTRLLRFIVSEDIAYVVELGHLYARFWYRGAPVLSGSTPLTLVTPWPSTSLPEIVGYQASIWRARYTQSVDVLYLAHSGQPPQRIMRTAEDVFVIEPYEFREGPFRAYNTNEARLMAVSATSGAVTVTSNFDVFTSSMIGMLVRLEVKALGTIKPWVQGDRSVAVGTYRRSEGKIYRASTVPSSGTHTETGNVRPTHDTGREWDGAGDSRTAGGVTWSVGVEWEYVHSGYGIAKITGYNNARSVPALVQVPFPPEVVGGLGVASNTWNLVGNGGTTFPVAGATSPVQDNYTVTVNGVPL